VCVSKIALRYSGLVHLNDKGKYTSEITITTQSEDPEAFKGTQHDFDVLFEVLANNPKRHAKVNA